MALFPYAEVASHFMEKTQSKAKIEESRNEPYRLTTAARASRTCTIPAAPPRARSSRHPKTRHRSLTGSLQPQRQPGRIAQRRERHGPEATPLPICKKLYCTYSIRRVIPASEGECGSLSCERQVAPEARAMVILAGQGGGEGRSSRRAASRTSDGDAP